MFRRIASGRLSKASLCPSCKGIMLAARCVSSRMTLCLVAFMVLGCSATRLTLQLSRVESLSCSVRPNGSTRLEMRSAWPGVTPRGKKLGSAAPVR